MRSICARNSFFSVRTFASSSLYADSAICLSIGLLYHLGGYIAPLCPVRYRLKSFLKQGICIHFQFCISPVFLSFTRMQFCPPSAAKFKDYFFPGNTICNQVQMGKDRPCDRSFPIFFGRLDEKKFCLLQELRYGSFVKETSESCYKSIKSPNIMSSCVPAAVSPSGGRRRTPPAPPGSPPPGCRQPARGGGGTPP